MSKRILWDDVPLEIKADLRAREPDKVGSCAIVTAVAGERWYFRRTAYGWNHLSTDTVEEEVASDLTDDQAALAKAEADARTAKVDKLLESMRTKAEAKTKEKETMPPAEKPADTFHGGPIWSRLGPPSGTLRRVESTTGSAARPVRPTSVDAADGDALGFRDYLEKTYGVSRQRAKGVVTEIGDRSIVIQHKDIMDDVFGKGLTAQEAR